MAIGASDSTRRLLLPDGVRDLLRLNPGLEAGVLSVANHLFPLLAKNRTTFFPEYTDHGIDHVENVVATGWWLMSDEAKNLLTPEDAAVFVLAVLLHDLALHLSKPGLAAMCFADSHQPVEWFVVRYGELGWDKTWNEFCQAARRFGSRINTRLFGSPDPVSPPRITPQDLYEPWNDKQYLLVGEFIRRFHGRMAHEFALHGFPSDESLDLAAIIGDERITDLAGLVARSHSLPIRDCVEYLSQSPSYFGNHRDPAKVHAPFLMAVLRVADYLQVDRERAPAGLLVLSDRLRSPISRQEWSAHAAVAEMRTTGTDAEAVEINCLPESTATFLHVKRILAGIQTELDQSWAVLGEVYSENAALRKLGLRVRRVRSNLDNSRKFQQTVRSKFVPVHACFRSSDAELLQLLVDPLYGSNPNVGVRELIQNAVDAVRERCESDSGFEYSNSDCDVKVTIKLSNPASISVVDRGVGMTDNIIVDYFLNAGSSFRSSDAWRAAYLEEGGKVKVLRSGRFGVGALAGFLLGEELCVSTRSYRHSDGLKFRASIDTDPINLEVESGREVGTSISISLSDGAVERLRNITSRKSRGPGKYLDDVARELHWYYLEKPRLEISVDGEQFLPRRELLPAEGTKPLPEGWYRLNAEGFSDLQWTYSIGSTFGGKFTPKSSFFCNGILIPHAKLNSEMWQPSAYWPGGEDGVFASLRSLRVPLVSVFDRTSSLPLALDRMSLSANPSFCNDLCEAVIQDIFSKAVREYGRDEDGGFVGLDHHAIYGAESFWCSIGDGILPKSFLPHTRLWPTCHVIEIEKTVRKVARLATSNSQVCYLQGAVTGSRVETLSWIRSLMDGKYSAHSARGGLIVLGRELVVRSDPLFHLSNRVKSRLSERDLVGDRAYVCSWGHVSDEVRAVAVELAMAAHPGSRIMVLDVPLPPEQSDMTMAAAVWKKMIGDGPLLSSLSVNKKQI